MRIKSSRKLSLAVLLATACALAACSSSIADWPGIGTPADAPAKPRDPGTYLPVHDIPPDRDEAIMPPAERAKIESQLIAARDRQAATTPKEGAAK
jgi:hypothetical protein